ncbi:MAG TPA: lytic transglycosylase domain-containing protein [Chitinophagaceae bacterium]|nr:lytic transglycosylase domain-containing protein [Chitinophagaceae bacterium]
MFGKNLFKTALAASGSFFIAATPATHPGLTASSIANGSCPGDSVVKERTHRVGTNGFCSCLPELSPEQLEKAPRVNIPTQAERFVESYLRQNRYGLERIRARSAPYFSVIEKVFSGYELPLELKYLAVIESRLNSTVVSPAGAVGLWQFMPASARTFGLRTGGVDERKNSHKSSVAAARYLLYLYRMFDDWLLTVASYNSGPAPVLSAIRRSGSRDYWQLERFLPLETRTHVRKFIATHYFFEGHGSLVTMTRSETTSHFRDVDEFIRALQPADSLKTQKVIAAAHN